MLLDSGWALYVFSGVLVIGYREARIILIIELNRWLMSNSGYCFSDNHTS